MNAIMKEFPDFKMYNGFDDQFLDNIDYGGCGSIGALSNILPKLCTDWVAAKNSGDVTAILENKNRIHRLMRLYAIDTNCPGLFKEILKARGMNISTTTLFPFDRTRKVSIEEGVSLVAEVAGE
jgi:4-hydroxy-tetrahydrodipicolinate synthase